MINYIPKIAKVNKQERFNAITNVLREYNIPFTVQNIPHPYALGNIIVEINKDKPENTLVSAHYDNVYGTPGANDNASACSILLNLIIEAKNTDKHITFVFFDLEETRENIGSKTYLSINKSTKAINLDMCGLGNNIVYTLFNYSPIDSFEFEKFANNYQAVRTNDLPQGDAYTFQKASIPTIYIVNSTDHDIGFYKTFNRYDTGCYEKFLRTDFAKTMHQPNDTIDTINIEQVEKIFKFVKDCLSI